MYFTGFADEAAYDISGQIKATQQLGWKDIESRNIKGRNIVDIPDNEFDDVVDALGENGIQINCFGSAIANWSKQITDPFEETVQDVKKAIARMQRLGTRMIRIMSYAVVKDRGPDDQMEAERFRRLREMIRMFDDAGVTAVHENCMNYGGMSWQHALRLTENVPGLKWVYDTGNPVFSIDRSQAKPYPKQSSWDFYQHLKDHLVYIHIKDGRWDGQSNKMEFTFPGEGDGDVCRILKDLLTSGYDGGISIEPHLSTVHHRDTNDEIDEKAFATYVEYGNRVTKIVEQIKTSLCHS